MVQPDGSLDPEYNAKKDRTTGKDIEGSGSFFRGFTYANYVSYQKEDKFDYLILLNMNNQNYSILSTADQLNKEFKNGSSRITSGVDFNDPQNKTATQIFSGTDV